MLRFLPLGQSVVRTGISATLGQSVARETHCKKTVESAPRTASSLQKSLDLARWELGWSLPITANGIRQATSQQSFPKESRESR